MRILLILLLVTPLQSFALDTAAVTLNGKIAESLLTLLEKNPSTKEFSVPGNRSMVGGPKKVLSKFVCYKETYDPEIGPIVHETYCEINEIDKKTSIQISEQKVKIILMNGNPEAKVLLEAMKYKGINGAPNEFGNTDFKADHIKCTIYKGNGPFVPGQTCTITPERVN